jgi:putative flippase GtrA
MRVEARRLFRYLLTGAVAWLADVVVFTASLEVLGIALAQLLARTTGAVLAFFGHKLFVFDEVDLQRSTLTRQGVRYAVLWVWSYSVSTLALIGLIDHGGMNPLVAKVLVEVGIVVMNYLVMKGLIFPSQAGGGTRA